MPTPIPFNQIPQTNLVPFYFVEFDNSNSGVAGSGVQKSVLVGQTVNVVASTVVFVPTAAWAANYFGAGSHLALMAADYYDGDPEGELFAYPLADAGGGTAATGSILFTGPATGNGTLFLMIAGRELQIGVTSGQTAAQIATAVAAAVTAYLDSNGMALPVTAGAASATVTFTARNKGTLGNQIFIGLNFYGSANGEALPAGVGATVTAMSAGATDPDLGAVAAALGTTAYDFIALPGYTSTTLLNQIQTMMAFSAGRWSYAQQLYGHVFSAYQSNGSSSGSDLLTFGAARNDPHISVIGYEASCPNPPWEVASSAMGVFAQASKASSPARPSQTLICPNLIAAPSSSRFGFNVHQSLLSTGIATLHYRQDGAVAIERMATTYQLNSWSQQDRSYLDAETMYSFMYYTRQQKADLTQKFPRALLAQDGTNFGQQGNFGADTPSIVTPKVMATELRANYARMCPGGDLLPVVQDPANYKPICQINGANPNRMDVLDDPIMIGGLRMIAVLNQFRLIDPLGTATA